MFKYGKLKYDGWVPLRKGDTVLPGDVICGPLTNPESIRLKGYTDHWLFFTKKVGGIVIRKFGVYHNCRITPDMIVKRPFSVYRLKINWLDMPVDVQDQQKKNKNRFVHKFRLNPFHSAPLPLP